MRGSSYSEAAVRTGNPHEATGRGTCSSGCTPWLWTGTHTQGHRAGRGPGRRLRTAPGARALAGLTRLGFRVALSSVLLLRPKKAGSLSGTTGSLRLSSEGSGKAQMLCLYSSQV